MHDHGEAKLEADAAIAKLAIHDGRVHAFRGTGPALIGADWDEEDARASIEEHGAGLAGPFMTGMGHGVAVVDDTGPLFFETKEKEG